MFRLAPVLKHKFTDANDNPLAGGLLYTYVAGTSTPTTTYQDADGATPNTNPIVLDAGGECNLWIPDGFSFKFVLKNADDVTQWTQDKVTNPGQGSDGNTILYGSGAPDDSLGEDGNFYIDTDDKFMYGPKAMGVWPAGASLKGDPGDGLLRAGIADIPNDASQVTCAFSSDVEDVDYIPDFRFINLVDEDPIFLTGIVVAQTASGFTVKLNRSTDSANYKMGFGAYETI